LKPFGNSKSFGKSITFGPQIWSILKK
jgi:hypothetical protein